jgi:hypothetical protein
MTSSHYTRSQRRYYLSNGHHHVSSRTRVHGRKYNTVHYLQTWEAVHVNVMKRNGEMELRLRTFLSYKTHETNGQIYAPSPLLPRVIKQPVTVE